MRKKAMNIISIDFGMKGAYALFIGSKIKEVFFIPTKKIQIEPKKKKIVGTYKNGKPKYKIVNNAKYKTEIDWLSFKKHLIKIIKENNIDVVVIERQQGIAGNSARSSTTISKNYGMIFGFLNTLTNTQDLFQTKDYIKNIIEVSPMKWKKDLGILGIKDKKERKNASIKLAKELGYIAKRDDDAEAFLIGYWYIKEQKDDYDEN